MNWCKFVLDSFTRQQTKPKVSTLSLDTYSTQLNSSLIRTVAWEAKRNTEIKDTYDYNTKYNNKTHEHKISI